MPDKEFADDVLKSDGFMVELEIDMHELACVIGGAVLGIKPPEGKSPEEAMQEMEEETRERFYRAAEKTMLHLVEIIGPAILKTIQAAKNDEHATKH